MSSVTKVATQSAEKSQHEVQGTLRPLLTLVTSSDRVRGQIGQIDLTGMDEVELGRGEGTLTVSSGKVRWAYDDNQSSRIHARLRSIEKGWRLDDIRSKNGAFVNGKRVESAILHDGDWFRTGSTLFTLQYHRVPWMPEKARSKGHTLNLRTEVGPLTTLLPSFERHLTEALELAATSLPLLISGRTGTGKELVARELHRASSRPGKFIAVNCGAIPKTLIESELFGHKRGAFSGATFDREGLVRAAHGGTLFLDEIGELNEQSQVALLRVLQEREVRPVGETKPVPVDVRFVSATHQDLPAAVEKGTFREDLFARLAGHLVCLPTLRERRVDLGIILSRLLHRHSPRTIRTFSTAAMELIARYRFPLNIRELEQAIERAVTLSEGGKITARHLPDQIVELESAKSAKAEDVELDTRLRRVLAQTNGNIAATARAFGKAPIQIRRWCERLDIDFRRFR